MSEDTTSDSADETGEESESGGGPLGKGRERLGEGADRAVASFDEGIVDVLSWMLDTETRARIYVYLRQHPWSTSEEVAEGTGLYPSTVREALAELADEEKVDRRKRQSEGAGNNPYEYTAIAPSDLVGSVVGQVQDQLNEVFNLDRRLDEDDEAAGEEPDPEPVRIEVESADEGDEDADPTASDEDPETNRTDDDAGLD